MSRIGLVKPSELTPEQEVLYDQIESYTTGEYGDKFIYRDGDGCFTGPLGILMHDPALCKAMLDVVGALHKLPGLPIDVRECAILGTSSRTQAIYEQYAHLGLAPFPPEELKLLENGTCPEHFSPARKVAFALGRELGKPGPLDPALWNEAVEHVGKEGAAALIHYVGFYSYVSIMLNGFDEPVPKTNGNFFKRDK